MRENLVENIPRLHALAALAFDPDGPEAQSLGERGARERVFLSRHCLDWWDLEEALRNIYDCFMDTLEALRYVYMLDEDEALQRRKEFNNKFIWHFFIVPIIEWIREIDVCDVKHPAMMIVAVEVVLDDIRALIAEDDSEASYEDALVARSVMMARM